MDGVKSELFEALVVVKHQTERAVLINDGGDADIWLPLSQVDLAPSGDGKHHVVTMPAWLAVEKEMA